MRLLDEHSQHLYFCMNEKKTLSLLENFFEDYLKTSVSLNEDNTAFCSSSRCTRILKLTNIRTQKSFRVECEVFSSTAITLTYRSVKDSREYGSILRIREPKERELAREYYQKVLMRLKIHSQAAYLFEEQEDY